MESPREKTSDLLNHWIFSCHLQNHPFLNYILLLFMQIIQSLSRFIFRNSRGYSKIVSSFLILVYSWDGACNCLFFKSKALAGVCLRPMRIFGPLVRSDGSVSPVSLRVVFLYTAYVAHWSVAYKTVESLSVAQHCFIELGNHMVNMMGRVRGDVVILRDRDNPEYSNLFLSIYRFWLWERNFFLYRSNRLVSPRLLMVLMKWFLIQSPNCLAY